MSNGNTHSVLQIGHEHARQSKSAMIWAIVPAKLGTNSKERLAPALPPGKREELARAMLTDVLRALAGAAAIDRCLVVSPDPAARPIAISSGAEFLAEEGAGGLNGSVEQAIHHASAGGASAVLVSMGDIPLLCSRDVLSAVGALPRRGAVLVPSADGTGTNLTVVRPPDLLRPRFGPGSLSLHLAQKSDRLPILVHPLANAALDIDTPADLERFRSSAPKGSTSAALLEAGSPIRTSVGA